VPLVVPPDPPEPGLAARALETLAHALEGEHPAVLPTAEDQAALKMRRPRMPFSAAASVFVSGMRRSLPDLVGAACSPFHDDKRICLSGEVDATGVLYAVILPGRVIIEVRPDRSIVARAAL
jgi:hypothetical protein